MHLAHLSLTNVRTFRQLELDLEPGIHVVVGGNAQGKTNLVEAIQLLATTRGRHGADVDLIAWDAIADEPLPAARIAAAVETARGPVNLEVSVIARPSMSGGTPTTSRRFRVNGVARRASDLIGRLRVVMFSADDLAIIEGAPAGRRRYLDITLSQLDGAYVRALQRYGRVLQQRNSLLRNFRERRHDPNELDFWDDELSAAGATLLAARDRAIAALAPVAAERYAELAPGASRLELCYRPAVPESVAAVLREPELAERVREAVVANRRSDIRRGLTQIGPHRDDVGFLLGGHEAGSFASRGEQRTAALALRLAEVDLSRSATGDPPVLLLDDILSELDAARRDRVLAVAYAVDQVLITTPDEDRPGRDALPEARRYRIEGGVLTPA